VIVLDHLVFAGDTAADRGAAGLRVRLLTGLDRLAVSCADVVVGLGWHYLRRIMPSAPGVRRPSRSSGPAPDVRGRSG
jgi:hypothetical protein